jgi:hypothetical protein
MIRLAPVRRAERQLLDDLAQEAQSLHELGDPASRRLRAPAIQAFHKRRVALAERLAQRLAPPSSDGVA